jgi:hypothetical protein
MMLENTEDDVEYKVDRIKDIIDTFSTFLVNVVVDG